MTHEIKYLFMASHKLYMSYMPIVKLPSSRTRQDFGQVRSGPGQHFCRELVSSLNWAHKFLSSS